MKILIIEDEQEVREEMTDILKFEGYDVIPVSNGAEGVKAAVENSPDIVICDILMPGMDGFEVLQKIKSHPAFSLVPFIFVSAMAERKSLRKGMEQGADDYLFKPFSREELLKALESRIQKVNAIQNQLDQLKKNIIFTLPHELRTPLNGILGFSKIIKDDYSALSEKDIGEMVHFIYQSGTRLYQLIQKYLMFIDVEMNSDYMKVKKVFLSEETLGELARNLAESYHRSGDLRMEVAEIPLEVSEKWFYFALNETIDNAFKFSAPGQQVFVRAKKNAHAVEISVTDRGRGFSPGAIEKVNAFMQFERNIFEQQGTGLGLFLAKRIINLHGGKMRIENPAEGGAVITIQVPLQQ